MAEAKRRRAAAAAFAAVAQASNRKRIEARLARRNASAAQPISSSCGSTRSAFRCVRSTCALLLKFGLVALLALLVTAGTMLAEPFWSAVHVSRPSPHGSPSAIDLQIAGRDSNRCGGGGIELSWRHGPSFINVSSTAAGVVGKQQAQMR